jgi:hypothetical protein
MRLVEELILLLLLLRLQPGSIGSACQTKVTKQSHEWVGTTLSTTNHSQL